MSDFLVDTNVIVDILTHDMRWSSWSFRALSEAAATANIVINPIVYAELWAGDAEPDEVEAALATGALLREDLPWEAARRAGEAFRQYRQRGGPRTTPLPDFYIGAHAEVRGYSVITRDPQRFRAYFPAVALVSP